MADEVLELLLAHQSFVFVPDPAMPSMLFLGVTYSFHSRVTAGAQAQSGSNIGDPSGAEVDIQAGQSSSPCKIDRAGQL